MRLGGVWPGFPTIVTARVASRRPIRQKRAEGRSAGHDHGGKSGLMSHFGSFHPLPRHPTTSCPDLFRVSTSGRRLAPSRPAPRCRETWMAGTSPAMTAGGDDGEPGRQPGKGGRCGHPVLAPVAATLPRCHPGPGPGSRPSRTAPEHSSTGHDRSRLSPERSPSPRPSPPRGRGGFAAPLRPPLLPSCLREGPGEGGSVGTDRRDPVRSVSGAGLDPGTSPG